MLLIQMRDEDAEMTCDFEIRISLEIKKPDFSSLLYHGLL